MLTLYDGYRNSTVQYVISVTIIFCSWLNNYCLLQLVGLQSIADTTNVRCIWLGQRGQQSNAAGGTTIVHSSW